MFTAIARRRVARVGAAPFCLASGTDWQAAGITHATEQQMMDRGLIERQAAPPRSYDL